MNAYRQIFVDFCRAELASGGPDPQVRLVGETLKEFGHSPAKTAFHCGLFVAPYTVGAGTVLQWLDRVDYPREAWAPFLIEHKAGFPMRRERRAVWGDDRVKLMRCIESYEAWTNHHLEGLQTAPYREIYASIDKHCAYFGRYATMKVIETLKRAGVVKHGQDTIVGKGAKYPRKMLALLFPEYAELINSKDNTPTTLQWLDALARHASEWTEIEMTWFQLETLLCNSRQSLDGKYAGRSHDRELAHWRKASGYFRELGVDLRQEFPFYKSRAAMFPHQYLGEKGDPPWWGSREQLEVEQKARIRDALVTG